MRTNGQWPTAAALASGGCVRATSWRNNSNGSAGYSSSTSSTNNNNNINKQNSSEPLLPSLDQQWTVISGVRPMNIGDDTRNHKFAGLRSDDCVELAAIATANCSDDDSEDYDEQQQMSLSKKMTLSSSGRNSSSSSYAGGSRSSSWPTCCVSDASESSIGRNRCSCRQRNEEAPLPLFSPPLLVSETAAAVAIGGQGGGVGSGGDDRSDEGGDSGDREKEEAGGADGRQELIIINLNHLSLLTNSNDSTKLVNCGSSLFSSRTSLPTTQHEPATSTTTTTTTSTNRKKQGMKMYSQIDNDNKLSCYCCCCCCRCIGNRKVQSMIEMNKEECDQTTNFGQDLRRSENEIRLHEHDPLITRTIINQKNIIKNECKLKSHKFCHKLPMCQPDVQITVKPQIFAHPTDRKCAAIKTPAARGSDFVAHHKGVIDSSEQRNSQPTTFDRSEDKHRRRRRRKCSSSSSNNSNNRISSLLSECRNSIISGKLSNQLILNNLILQIVGIVLIYSLITSLVVIVPVSSTNYWPSIKASLASSGRHSLTNSRHNPSDQQTTSTSAHQPRPGPLLIGQHYNNFSSIIPYSIVQDSDYGGSMQEDQTMDEEQQQQQLPLHHQLQSHQLDQLEHQLRQQLSSLPLDIASSDTKQEQHQQVEMTRSDSGSGGKVSEPSSANDATVASKQQAKSRALLQSLASQLDSNRLMLPQMQQIKSRFNQGCVGGTKCQFFAFCWMSGGSLGASCGLLMTCCVTPSRQEIQPGFYGPVVNDPYCGRSTSKINRIVGGTDASFGQFPWQAFVQVGGSRCGGALISSRHVVTAGHCVARSQHTPSSIKVTLGDYILNSDIESIPHEVFSVVEVLLHPNFRFTPQADRYDVAVLELDRTASYKDNIKPICLPQKDAAFAGRVAYVAGWGALQAGSKLRPKVLQHVAVPVIENQVCEGWHRRKGIDIRIYDEMMCAGYELGQRDACQGDSGGPLMLNQFGVWYLVGIVSAGYSCAKQYQPGIYHRVSSSSDWISSNIYQQGASN